MKKIGIIGAMELEVETLKEKMNVKNIVKRASMEFYEGTLNGTEAVVVRCGICKVNAGICVQILTDVFQVTHIINTGVAGGLDSQINIGDIVVSKDALYHDVDATIFGYQPGEVPQMGQREFIADTAMIAAAIASCQEVNPDINIIRGRVVSGDQFICEKTVKERLIHEFNGSCAEMEGAAIAQAATLNQLPFVILRAISDKADESAQVEYPEFERKAAADCAKLVFHMVKSI